jgi:hypothetical protein
MKLQGLPVDRSTLAFWVGVAAAELKPIYLRMKELLLGSAIGVPRIIDRDRQDSRSWRRQSVWG